MGILKGILVKRQLKKSEKRSLRVGVEFRIPSKRIFNGREYRTFDWKTSVSAAKKIAKEQREVGYKARFAEQWSGDGRKGWAVYIRK